MRVCGGRFWRSGAVRKGSVPARIYRLIQVARMTIYGDWAADVANPAKVHRPEDAVGRRAIKVLEKLNTKLTNRK